MEEINRTSTRLVRISKAATSIMLTSRAYKAAYMPWQRTLSPQPKSFNTLATPPLVQQTPYLESIFGGTKYSFLGTKQMTSLYLSTSVQS